METGKHTGRFQLIDRLSEQVGSRDKAIEILQKRGHLRQNSMEFTEEGAKRNRMTAEERAIDRASKRSGKPKRAFRYNKQDNSATLKDNWAYRMSSGTI